MSEIANLKMSIELPSLSAENLPSEKLRVFDSKHLFSGDAEVGILHDNAVYRLKVTKQGKLILNK